MGQELSRQISQIIKEDSAVLAVFITTSWRAVHQPEGQTVAFAYCKPFQRPQVNRETGQILVTSTKLVEKSRIHWVNCHLSTDYGSVFAVYVALCNEHD